LRAVGYRSGTISIIILVENAFLMVWGLASGVFCALVAILPAIHARGASIPFTRTALIVFAVLAAGLISSLIALLAARRAPLLTALRSD
jgi:ABC-type antimicrobial peptide transport system permease subunit